LRIEEDDKHYTVRPHHATDDPTDLGDFDLIIMSVKATSLGETLKLISKNISDKTAIIPLLNGVDYSDNISQYYPDAMVFDGHIYILSNITAPGVVRKRGNVFRLVWGRKSDTQAETIEAVSALFDAAKLRHRYSETIEYESWKKFLFISAFAALTAYHDQSMDQITAEHSDELEALFREIVAVGQARGIPLGQEEINAAITQAAKVAPGAKTSLQLDIEQGKPAEIEALLGYVVREGARLGVDVPVMKKIYQALQNV
jgi:2-dehydropantoate 2-reductase